MNKTAYKIINGITLYRLLAAPFLFYLAFAGRIDLFKWLLPISFFTDLIDGFLARKFKVTSELGSRLDSIADDLTILASIAALFLFKKEFTIDQSFILTILFSLFIIQVLVSFVRYRKTTSFHTYLAKASAILQGSFLILMFLLPDPIYWLFYLASFVTFFELVEEIILVILLPKWQINVRGLYWVLKNSSNQSESEK
jgi:CDP-diacylglycerol--glycerol-3-phosphate 3-phosphatidyltransferase